MPFEVYDVNKPTSLSFSFPDYKIGTLVPHAMLLGKMK